MTRTSATLPKRSLSLVPALFSSLLIASCALDPDSFSPDGPDAGDPGVEALAVDEVEFDEFGPEEIDGAIDDEALAADDEASDDEAADDEAVDDETITTAEIAANRQSDWALDDDILDDDVGADDGHDVGNVALATPSSCGGFGTGSAAFRAVHFNVWGSTFGANWSARRSVVVKRMKYVLTNETAAKASVYGLTEVTKSEATWLANQLGSTYAVAVHNRRQAIIYNKATWTVRDTGKYTFTSGSTGYHGFVHARLQHKSSKRQVNVIEAHLSPNAVANAASKRASQLSQIKRTVGSWKNPVLVLGDMNWTATSLENAAGAGYCSVRKWAGTYYPSAASAYRTVGGAQGTYGSGGRIIDHGLVRNGISMTGYRVLRGDFDNKKQGSDHHMLTFHLTL